MISNSRTRWYADGFISLKAPYNRALKLDLPNQFP